jgi:hypothetical protein
MKGGTILLILIGVIFLFIGTCFAQVSVIQFNSNWNSKNTVDISTLKECETLEIIICDHPELQKKYGIISVPTIIILKDSVEIMRFEANILMKLTCGKRPIQDLITEIQTEIDNIYTEKIE